jgi:hypothetical protein
MAERCEFHGSNISPEVFMYVARDRYRHNSGNKVQTISHFLKFLSLPPTGEEKKRKI